jgi:hypothetical protein
VIKDPIFRIFALAFLSLLATVTTVTGVASEFEMQAVRFESPPLIDGKVDDAVWYTASSVSGLVQVRPFHSEASPLPTSVLLGYDDEAVYVAFRCETDADDAGMEAFRVQCVVWSQDLSP